MQSIWNVYVRPMSKYLKLCRVSSKFCKYTNSNQGLLVSSVSGRTGFYIEINPTVWKNALNFAGLLLDACEMHPLINQSSNHRLIDEHDASSIPRPWIHPWTDLAGVEYNKKEALLRLTNIPTAKHDTNPLACGMLHTSVVRISFHWTRNRSPAVLFLVRRFRNQHKYIALHARKILASSSGRGTVVAPTTNPQIAYRIM